MTTWSHLHLLQKKLFPQVSFCFNANKPPFLEVNLTANFKVLFKLSNFTVKLVLGAKLCFFETQHYDKAKGNS